MYRVPAVEKMIQVMKLLCDSERSLGVSQISHALGINKNMIFRLLRTLHKEGWIVQEGEPPKYRMSLQAFHYTSKPVARMDIRVAAHGPLFELWQETGESCYLGVLDDDRVLYLEHFDSVGSIKIAGRVGGRYLLHCSAPGKVLFAHADEKLFQRLAKEGFTQNTDRTITDPRQLKKNLEEIRRSGYALDMEEYARGLMCFAVPVFDYAERIAGTVGLSVLALNYSLDDMINKLGPKVIRTGREISLQLGKENP
ncbi:MAG: IclR family transcriptional regulator [Planctomycetes bacterium]|nr:IclR family transcriptional regulator [Planctomycetota bacterium]